MVLEHDDNISNPTRVGSGRWTSLLLELVAAAFLLGFILLALPMPGNSGVLWAMIAVLPWVILVFVLPRTNGARRIRWAYLAAAITTALGYYLFAAI